MNIAAKAAMLGEEPKKTRKQERIEKKVGRLAGKLSQLVRDNGQKYASTDTPKEEQSGKERRYHKKFSKTIDKFKEAANKKTDMEAKNSKTDFTRVPKDDKPASSSTSTGEEEPTSKKRGRYSDLNFTRVEKDDTPSMGSSTGLEPTKTRRERRQERNQDMRDYTRVPKDNNPAPSSSGNTEMEPTKTRREMRQERRQDKRDYTSVSQDDASSTSSGSTDITGYEPTMSRRERRQERKEDKREYTKVPQDDASSTATPTPSDIETKAAIVSGKYSLTKFKPKK